MQCDLKIKKICHRCKLKTAIMIKTQRLQIALIALIKNVIIGITNSQYCKSIIKKA